ncbi:hypothetical protein Airi02_096670 [Actinoallomurus iriomotensis]|uniref:Uncharacterized protein n=1 Tax=Actinoallomurus iriomotensis TaxID=478107 RepID=A0A9W6SDS1_9ACTN|nr:hypothetical protein Airi02_096670 [Actinoallomurus iriomotensis]
MIATAIPSRASRRAVAAPMPLDAPVTNATCSGIRPASLSHRPTTKSLEQRTGARPGVGPPTPFINFLQSKVSLLRTLIDESNLVMRPTCLPQARAPSRAPTVRGRRCRRREAQ